MVTIKGDEMWVTGANNALNCKNGLYVTLNRHLYLVTRTSSRVNGNA
jgi:hypothetical protein